MRQDTVMSDKAVRDEFKKYGFDMMGTEEQIEKIGNVIAIVRKAQAEITWDKAIREVVGWIEDGRLGRFVKPEEWQAQKKEWGD